MMNYGAMLVSGRGASDIDSPTSDLKEAQNVYERVIRLGRRMQARPSMPLPKMSSSHRAPAATEHMVAQAEAALQVIQARLARGASDTAEAPPQRSCTVM